MKKRGFVLILLFTVFFSSLVSADLPNFTAEELMGMPTESSIVINLINDDEDVSAYIEYGTISGNYTNLTQIQNVYYVFGVEHNDLFTKFIFDLKSDNQYTIVGQCAKSNGTTQSSHCQRWTGVGEVCGIS